MAFLLLQIASLKEEEEEEAWAYTSLLPRGLLLYIYDVLQTYFFYTVSDVRCYMLTQNNSILLLTIKMYQNLL